MAFEGLELMLRMGAAVLLGAIIGIERQRRQRMAGLRTNALVALGAAAYTAFSTLADDEVSPTRVAAQVVSGIGFLGAGVIMREGINVRGLNTAATLWCAAAVGVFAGGGYFSAAVMAASLVLAANIVLRPLAQRIDTHSDVKADTETVQSYALTLECNASVELHMRALVLQAVAHGLLRLRSISSRELEAQPGRVALSCELVSLEPAEDALEQLMRRFGIEPGVRSLAWQPLERLGTD
jgi:putative Mg2+ transporter-C (MgtC) family protein